MHSGTVFSLNQTVTFNASAETGAFSQRFMTTVCLPLKVAIKGQCHAIIFI